MKKLMMGLIVAVAGVVLSPAHAGEFADLRGKMSAARESLITMMLHKDKRGADQQKIVKDTADEVTAMLGKLKPPPGKEAKFKELSETWAAFKKTREAELVPAILDGRDEEARKLAGGIQKDRITKCQQLVSEIDG